ncbi:hypothetical protein QBC39DRAFT_31606 [Podospora conica]|nr:hypothetical protein QBC39DRAFT_31606 [Schizothecium conicum]
MQQLPQWSRLVSHRQQHPIHRAYSAHHRMTGAHRQQRIQETRSSQRLAHRLCCPFPKRDNKDGGVSCQIVLNIEPLNVAPRAVVGVLPEDRTRAEKRRCGGAERVRCDAPTPQIAFAKSAALQRGSTAQSAKTMTDALIYDFPSEIICNLSISVLDWHGRRWTALSPPLGLLLSDSVATPLPKAISQDSGWIKTPASITGNIFAGPPAPMLHGARI